MPIQKTINGEHKIVGNHINLKFKDGETSRIRKSRVSELLKEKGKYLAKIESSGYIDLALKDQDPIKSAGDSSQIYELDQNCWENLAQTSMEVR